MRTQSEYSFVAEQITGTPVDSEIIEIVGAPEPVDVTWTYRRVDGPYVAVDGLAGKIV